MRFNGMQEAARDSALAAGAASSMVRANRLIPSQASIGQQFTSGAMVRGELSPGEN